MSDVTQNLNAIEAGDPQGAEQLFRRRQGAAKPSLTAPGTFRTRLVRRLGRKMVDTGSAAKVNFNGLIEGIPPARVQLGQIGR